MPRLLAALATCAALSSCGSIPGAQHVTRSDPAFARIQAGMTQAEVRNLIGEPDNSMAFPLSRNFSWGYFYYDTWGYYAEFSVTFAPDGYSVSKVTRRINDGGDRGE